MSKLLRSILLASFVGALLVGCGAAEDAADAATEAAGTAAEAAADVATDAVDTAAEAAGDMAEAVSGEPGGYVLPEEDRVPGITE